MANWTRLSGSQSTLPPTSSNREGTRLTVGRIWASAGRSTPESIPRTIFAVAIAAPVFPAVKNPAQRPSLTIFRPTRMVESRLARTAYATHAAGSDAACPLAPPDEPARRTDAQQVQPREPQARGLCRNP